MKSRLPQSSFYAYLAGFIDADGSIFLSRNNRQGKSGISAWVFAFQSDPKILRWFLRATGYGIVRERVSYSPAGSPHLAYAWEIHKADEVRSLLTQIEKYLFIKKKRAKIVLAGAKLIGEPGQKLSPEDKRRRRKIWREWEKSRGN